MTTYTGRMKALRPHVRLLRAALLMGAALFVSCNELPTGPARTPGMPVRGVTLADWTNDGYASAAANQAVTEIAATGANTLVLIRTAYQQSTRSNQILVDSFHTPAVGALEVVASQARSLGLRVVIKPHVDVVGGQWRGDITPDDPDAWFVSYGAFVLDAAATARNIGAEQFVVGTELAGTVGYEARWRALIADVRRVFPGEVTYAASWDGAGRIGFWDAVDVVGVDFYGAVAQRDDPGRLEILAGWQPWLDRLHRLHQQTGKTILLTEVGYRSVDGAGREPFSFGDDRPIDVGEQADLYWAALQAVGDQDWIEGVYWWNWVVSGTGGLQDRDYTPRGKPAQGELTSAWKQ